ncbi:unnamed protein product [Orchesella dallaii]|uniref:Uncharacterized protein n=1 Tax=Orchesella dallaii TaxID=48710 RepID=A0ABP1Q332_9HEXA
MQNGTETPVRKLVDDIERKQAQKRTRVGSSPEIATAKMDSSSTTVSVSDMFKALLERFDKSDKQANDRHKELTENLDNMKKDMKEHRDEFNGQIESLQNENKRLKDELSLVKDKMLRLQEQSNNIYLIINGIPETIGETEEAVAAKLNEIIREDLELYISCTSARRLGKRAEGNPKIRPVRAYFTSQSDRFSVLKTKKKTPERIFIGPDYPLELRKVRKILTDKKKAVMKAKGFATILWSTFEIIVDGLKYHWTEVAKENEDNQMDISTSQ